MFNLLIIFVKATPQTSSWSWTSSDGSSGSSSTTTTTTPGTIVSSVPPPDPNSAAPSTIAQQSTQIQTPSAPFNPSPVLNIPTSVQASIPALSVNTPLIVSTPVLEAPIVNSTVVNAPIATPNAIPLTTNIAPIATSSNSSENITQQNINAPSNPMDQNVSNFNIFNNQINPQAISTSTSTVNSPSQGVPFISFNSQSTPLPSPLRILRSSQFIPVTIPTHIRPPAVTPSETIGLRNIPMPTESEFPSETTNHNNPKSTATQILHPTPTTSISTLKRLPLAPLPSVTAPSPTSSLESVKSATTPTNNATIASQKYQSSNAMTSHAVIIAGVFGGLAFIALILVALSRYWNKKHRMTMLNDIESVFRPPTIPVLNQPQHTCRSIYEYQPSFPPSSIPSTAPCSTMYLPQQMVLTQHQSNPPSTLYTN